MMDAWASNSLTLLGLAWAVAQIRGVQPEAACTMTDAGCPASWTMNGAEMERYGREGLRRADAHMAHLAGLHRARRIYIGERLRDVFSMRQWLIMLSDAGHLYRIAPAER